MSDAAGPALLTPDSPLVARLAPSPNFGARRAGRGIDMIVLHYTGCPSAESACLWMCCEEAQVSAHYLVDEDGEIVQLVAEAARAWHAGVAHWAGEDDINSCSVGIEIQNAGHEGGLPPYPEAQMRAVKALVVDIMARHGVPPWRVVGHSDVAPARKADPGEHFPWRELAARGLALPAPDISLPPARGLTEEETARLRQALARIGYGVAGQELAVLVRAFQRRFWPERVDGVADAQVLALAEAVAGMVDAARARA